MVRPGRTLLVIKQMWCVRDAPCSLVYRHGPLAVPTAADYDRIVLSSVDCRLSNEQETSKRRKAKTSKQKRKPKGRTSCVDFLIFRRFDFWTFDIISNGRL